jgi:hypothetical protein
MQFPQLGHEKPPVQATNCALQPTCSTHETQLGFLCPPFTHADLHDLAVHTMSETWHSRHP